MKTKAQAKALMEQQGVQVSLFCLAVWSRSADQWLTLGSPSSERYEGFSPNDGKPGLEYTQKGY
ncbi:MAG: hypothetical protein K0M39_09380 [Rhizobium sp.]|nr:hypothetical protein [Rhizobium sp.]